MEDTIWEPYGDYLEKSNVAIFMRKHGIGSYKELIKRSIDDIEWFWNAMMEDRKVEWYKPYETTLDLANSRSFEWARWFIGGKINIAHNTLDRHANDPLARNRLAFIWEGEDFSTRKWTKASRCELSNRRQVRERHGDTTFRRPSHGSQSSDDRLFRGRSHRVTGPATRDISQVCRHRD